MSAINYADNSRCDMDTCVGLSSGTAGLYKMGNKESGNAYNIQYPRPNTMFDANQASPSVVGDDHKSMLLLLDPRSLGRFHGDRPYSAYSLPVNSVQFAGRQRLAIILTGSGDGQWVDIDSVNQFYWRIFSLSGSMQHAAADPRKFLSLVSVV